jgi:hypothetical protein
MFVVREIDAELRYGHLPFLREIKYLFGIWKRVSRAITRRRICVAVSAYCGLRSVEKLAAMAIQARSVFGIVRHVGESRLSFAHLIPVGSRKLMARIACPLLVLRDAMRECRVIGALRLFDSPRVATVCLGAALGFISGARAKVRVHAP